ncbi:MAG: MFS transporter [Eubacterium sp.]|nr:MFS transporter [Eubacterium sp.]
MNKNKTLSVSSALIYAMGIFGVQIFIGYMNSFQTEFYNKMYSSFDSSIFYASAIIIFVAKLISCLFDPLIGAMIDKSELKGGKMRPWVLRSAFPLAVLTTLIFVYIPFDQFGGKILLYAYITVTTVLWNIAMSFADIPSQGMLSLLSPDADERNVAASFSNIAKSMALALPGVFVTVVMMIIGMIKGEGNYEDKEYYLITALVFFVIGTSLILLMYKKNKEAVESSKSAQTVSIKEMFREMKMNKMIFIVFLINMLGFARAMGLIVCVQANGALIGKINLFGMVMDTTADATWLPGILGGVSGFIGICIVPLINKKLGEKKTYIGFSIATFIFNMAVTVFYWLLPQESALRYGNTALYMIMAFQFLTGFLTAANTYIPLVMTADIVDYRLYKTGERKEGVNFAILSLSIKLSNAICVAVGLLLIAASGYTQVVYETGSIPAKMQNIIMFSYMGFVGVSALISAIPMFFYKIDNKVKAEMRKDNNL